MSRRKLSRRNKGSFKPNTIYNATTIFVQNPDGGEIETRYNTNEIPANLMEYMPVYQRAHKLMPPPKSIVMDPVEYSKEMPPSVQILKETQDGTQIETDKMLRAIAILGHTPCQDALHALATFSQSKHSLSPIAELALAECSSLVTLFKGEEGGKIH